MGDRSVHECPPDLFSLLSFQIPFAPVNVSLSMLIFSIVEAMEFDSMFSKETLSEEAEDGTVSLPLFNHWLNSRTSLSLWLEAEGVHFFFSFTPFNE